MHFVTSFKRTMTDIDKHVEAGRLVGDHGAGAASPETDTSAIREALRQVLDPEVGINIVDLGLVYRIDLAPDCLRIEMTMTSPACPMGEMIMDDAYAALDKTLPDSCQREIVLVWEPPWDPSKISQRGKSALGWAES